MVATRPSFPSAFDAAPAGRLPRLLGAVAVMLITAGAGAALLMTVGGDAPAGPEAPRLHRIAEAGLTGGAICATAWVVLWLRALRTAGPGRGRRIAAGLARALSGAALLVLAAGPVLGLAAALRLAADAQAADESWALLAAPGFLAAAIGRCALLAIPLLMLARGLERVAARPVSPASAGNG